MSQDSISGWLSTANSLRSRLSELKGMKDSLSTRTRYTDREEIIEPTYDIKDVDKKVSELQVAIFRIDRSIKEANALTKVEINVDYESLMQPLQ